MAKSSGLSSAKSYEVDMCHGPLLGQIIRFTIPLIVSGILQLCFHSADLIVIGRFASHEALAAVGATVSLGALLVNIFIGLSVGTNVLVARYIGADDPENISKTVHTSIAIGLIGGFLLAAIGVIFAKPMLQAMGTPADILDMSTLYMQICFGGMPVMLLYNFGSAVMRARGDTTRPFYFLLISGIINVLLNLFFVLILKWDVAGVATATVTAQAISAILVLHTLNRMDGPCRLKWKKLRLDRKSIKEILWIGFPAGFQASCFSISNILIQSSINLFGSAAIAGMTAAGSWENISYITVSAIGTAAISFVGQNMGGKQVGRIKRSALICLTLGCICAIFISIMLLIFSRPLLSVFNTDPKVLDFGEERFWVVVPLLFICAAMEVASGILRGLGHSVEPTVITVFCVCVLRVIWIYTIFRNHQTITMLMASYPVTWILNTAGVLLLLRHVIKKVSAQLNNG